jgi:hypothetical protein
MSVLSSRVSRRSWASTTGQIPHWSEVASGPLRTFPSENDCSLGGTTSDDERDAIGVAAWT